MSIALAHFAIGASLTQLVVTYLVPRVRYPRAWTVLGGLWAMVPDAYWVVPAFRPVLRPLHRSVWANLFWFHRALDRFDTSDSRTVAAVAVLGFLGVTVLAERREYRAVQRLLGVAPAE